MKTNNQLKILRAKSKSELIKLLRKDYKKLTEYKFSLAFRKLKNVRIINNTKKNVARIWTVISEKNIKENN